MAVLRFAAAVLVTCLALDSVISHAMVVYNRPEMVPSLAVLFAAKLVASVLLVGFALWLRSAWAAWRE